MKNNKVNKILVIALVAIIIIPMLYSSIYLKAFWDTYGGVDNVPVAFVNLDKHVYKNGEKYNIGEDLSSKLQSNNQVHWVFTDYKEAQKGVEDGKYYALIVIPEDFSKKLADVNDGKIIKPEIIYEANVGKNYVFSQISSKVAQGIKGSISEKLQKNLSKVLVDNLYNVKEPLKTASDGSLKIQNGSSQLLDGNMSIKNGMDKALAGIGSLHDGLNTMSLAQQKILAGTVSLKDGLNKFKAGFSQNNEDLNKLTTGAKQLSDGISTAKAGLVTGKENLSEKLNEAADGVDKLSDNITSVNSMLNSALDHYKATGALNSDDLKNLLTAAAITSAMDKSNVKANISNPLRNASNGFQPLIDGLGTLNDGAKDLYSGTETLTDTINSTQSTAATGADKLLQGADNLEAGNKALLDGINTTVEKTGELYSGVTNLDNGVASVNDGIKNINSGSTELSSGLLKGYNKINDNLKFSSEEMSDFISNPVVLKDTSINTVKYYGEGLAPYFMSLSLWLGAMFVNLLFSILNKVKNNNSYKKGFAKKYALGSIIVIVQASLLSFVMLSFIKISVTNVATFYINNMLTGLAFFSVIYGVACILGIIGTPIMFIVFLLQLASCGGTFPIETAPSFYRIINTFLPMTYSVSSLRMVISGINTSLYAKNTIILIIFTVLFLAAALLIDIIRNRKAIKKIQNTKAA